MLEGGNRAHWALLVGLAWKTGVVSKGTSLDPLVAAGWSWQDEPPAPLELTEEVMVVARQSKSLVLGLWPRDELVESCLNLKAFQPRRGKEVDKYMIPEGGVEAGLAGKMVLLPPIHL